MLAVQPQIDGLRDRGGSFCLVEAVGGTPPTAAGEINGELAKITSTEGRLQVASCKRPRAIRGELRWCRWSKQDQAKGREDSRHQAQRSDGSVSFSPQGWVRGDGRSLAQPIKAAIGQDADPEVQGCARVMNKFCRSGLYPDLNSACARIRVLLKLFLML